MLIDDYDNPTCPNCGASFAYRSNKYFCSAKCRKSSHNKEIKAGRLGAASTKDIRATRALYQLNEELSHKLYTTKPSDRLGYIEETLQEAKANGGLLKRLLTNWHFLRPDPTRNLGRFYRGQRCYLTFPQACNQYLLASPRRCGVVQFMQDDYREATGEVFSDGSIDPGPAWDFGPTETFKAVKANLPDPIMTRHYKQLLGWEVRQSMTPVEKEISAATAELLAEFDLWTSS